MAGAMSMSEASAIMGVSAFSRLTASATGLLGPFTKLIPITAAAGAAYYGITSAMEAFALPEVVRMMKDWKEGLKSVASTIGDFMRSAGLGALADLFSNLGGAVAEFFSFIKSPVNFGKRLGEFIGGGYEAYDAEKTRQRIEAMNKRLAASAAGAVPNLEAAVGGTMDVIDQAAAELQTIVNKYRPDKSLFDEFRKNFEELYKSNELADPVTSTAFYTDIKDQYAKLNENMQTRFRMQMESLHSSFDITTPDGAGKFSAMYNFKDEFFKPEDISKGIGAVIDGIKERITASRAEAAENVKKKVFDLFQGVAEAMVKAKEAATEQARGLVEGIQSTWAELATARNLVADYEWGRYNRQMTVGTAATTQGEGAFVSAVINQALGVVQAPSSQSPEERALSEINNAQWRSVALQERLVALQEQFIQMMANQQPGGQNAAARFAIGY